MNERSLTHTNDDVMKRFTKTAMAGMILAIAGTPMAADAAATYYVSQSSGDDVGDGKSPATAWKTLARASEATYAPGDKILLKCGDTWGNDTLRPKGSGTPDNPITIALLRRGQQAASRRPG